MVQHHVSEEKAQCPQSKLHRSWGSLFDRKKTICYHIIFDDGYLFFHSGPLTPTSAPLSLSGDLQLSIFIVTPNTRGSNKPRSFRLKWTMNTGPTLVTGEGNKEIQPMCSLYWSWEIFDSAVSALLDMKLRQSQTMSVVVTHTTWLKQHWENWFKAGSYYA